MTPERFIITTIGEKKLPGTDGIGGDKRAVKLGFHVELIDRQGDPDDGGPIALCACYDVASAQRIRSALELLALHTASDLTTDQRIHSALELVSKL